jgi:hypothetical protein
MSQREAELDVRLVGVRIQTMQTENVRRPVLTPRAQLQRPDAGVRDLFRDAVSVAKRLLG